MPDTVGQLGWRHSKTAVTSEKAQPYAEARYWSSSVVTRLLYLLVGIYAITFISLSLAEHDSFRTNAFDLGNMDQAVWNTAQGRWFAFTNWEGGTSRLAAHVEPILILIAQAYRLKSDPKMLLILQSLVLSLGALPAFWLARQKLRNDFAALTFVAAYLLAPELEAANLADFHPVALSASFLLYAFYFAARRSYALFGVFATLAMSTKEEIPLVVCLLGLYIAFVQRDRRVGLATSAIALLWFCLAFFVIIPAHNKTGASPYLSRYDYMGGSPRDILSTLISQPGRVISALFIPQKIEYLRSLFMPVLFLSAFSPVTAALALPDLGINLLSTFAAMYTGGSHYSSAIIPFVVVSGIHGLANLSRLLSRFGVRLAQGFVYFCAALVLVFSFQSYYTYFLRPLMDHFPSVTAHHRLGQEILANIPADAGVSASSSLNPHVSQRQRLSLFPETTTADYVVVDVTSTPYPIDDANLYYRLTNMLNDGSWGVVLAEDGYLLLKHGLINNRIPGDFYSFAKVSSPRVSHPMKVSFGELEFLGYDVKPDGALHGNDPYASATLYWRPQRSVAQDYLIVLLVIGVDGATVDVEGYQPTTLWYPTSRWQTDETLRVDVRRLPLQGRKSATVYLSVVAGRDPNDPAKRLPPLPSGTQNIARSADGTMLKLFNLRRG